MEALWIQAQILEDVATKLLRKLWWQFRLRILPNSRGNYLVSASDYFSRGQMRSS
jgi:hypothetical protein